MAFEYTVDTFFQGSWM